MPSLAAARASTTYRSGSVCCKFHWFSRLWSACLRGRKLMFTECPLNHSTLKDYTNSCPHRLLKEDFPYIAWMRPQIQTFPGAYSALHRWLQPALSLQSLLLGLLVHRLWLCESMKELPLHHGKLPASWAFLYLPPLLQPSILETFICSHLVNSLSSQPALVSVQWTLVN